MKEISMEKVEAARQAMLETVKSKSLTHEQKVATMANHADSLLSVLDLPEGLLEVLRCEPEKQCICDLLKEMLLCVPAISSRIMRNSFGRAPLSCR